MMWAVGIGMFLLIIFFLWMNEERFNERWLELGAGSWLPPEDETPVRGYVAYTISYPRAEWR